MQHSGSWRYDLDTTLEGYRTARRWLLVLLAVAVPVGGAWERFSTPVVSAQDSRMQVKETRTAEPVVERAWAWTERGCKLGSIVVPAAI